MILTPSIHASRSYSFSRRLRTRVVDMVAVAAFASAVTGYGRGAGGRGTFSLLCGDVGKLALRSEEVRSDGVGGDESDAERREAPDERCLGIVLAGVAGVKLMGRGGAGVSKKERYEMSGPPRRLTGTSIGAPLTWSTS